MCSSHRGSIISEREKKSGSDLGQFHYTIITDAQYHRHLSKENVIV